MADVTIIVPIYNVEKYVRDCFESLLAQTSDAFTVLAVNDGSPDNSEEIIKEYCAKYPEKIKGIKKANGGYGSVLQLAIKEIKTPYFLVCDPDDTLEPTAVETLLQLAKISNADITIGAKNFVYEDSTDKDYDYAYNKEFVTLKTNTVYNKGDEEFKDLFFIDPSPHAKLYKKEVAKNINFPEHVGYTDNLLFYISLLNSKKVIYTDTALANYLVNRTGNTMTDVSFKAMNAEILVFKTIVSQAEKLNDVEDIYWYRMFESYKFMLYQTRRVNCTKEDYEAVLNYLGTFASKLSSHGKAIKPYYKKYTKCAIVERLKDEALMNPKTFEITYKQIVKKMTKEFTSKADV